MAKKKSDTVTETTDLVEVVGSTAVEPVETTVETVAETVATDASLVGEIAGLKLKVADLEAQLMAAKNKKSAVPAPTLTEEQKTALQNLLEGVALVVRNSNNVEFRKKMKGAAAELSKLL